LTLPPAGSCVSTRSVHSQICGSEQCLTIQVGLYLNRFLPFVF